MATAEKDLNKFDKLPAPVQGLIGVASLAAISVIGFFVFFAFDILLLDFDPIGKLFRAIF